MQRETGVHVHLTSDEVSPLAAILRTPAYMFR
jgi:hypothetical protein